MLSSEDFEKYYGIQLGCFNQPAEGWYNTDITPHIFFSKVPVLPFILKKLNLINQTRYIEYKNGIFKNVHYLNLSKKFNIKNSVVKAYFSSHVLEHLYLSESKRLLSEIYRTLKPGGFVRLVLPDLNYGIKLYSDESPEEFLNFIFENQRGKLSKNKHKWMYTSKYMETLLINAGFKNVCEMEYKESNYQPFIFLDNRHENSFYIEAQK